MEVLPFIFLAALGFAFFVNVLTKLKARSLEHTPAPEFLDVLGEDAARHVRGRIGCHSVMQPPRFPRCAVPAVAASTGHGR